jgi:acrylyl-CoA reductase (NADPH)
MKYAGSVAAVGLAGGARLEHTVVPFLLRGVNLLGIDSVLCPGAQRVEAWRRLTSDLPLDKLQALSTEVRLEDVPRVAGEILNGQVRGRVVVNVNT